MECTSVELTPLFSAFRLQAAQHGCSGSSSSTTATTSSSSEPSAELSSQPEGEGKEEEGAGAEEATHEHGRQTGQFRPRLSSAPLTSADGRWVRLPVL